MADVCLSYDDRLTEATPRRTAVEAAARARVTAASSTPAPVGGGCTGTGVAAEV